MCCFHVFEEDQYYGDEVLSAIKGNSCLFRHIEQTIFREIIGNISSDFESGV